MVEEKYFPIIQVLLAAVLFGASAPLSKMLLGKIEPIPLAALLYLGSGICLLLYKTIDKLLHRRKANEAPLTKKDLPWLIGAVLFGGVLGPILQMSGLKRLLPLLLLCS